MNVPSLAYSAAHCPSWDSRELSYGISQYQPLSIDLNPYIVFKVLGLLFFRCPSAVVRRVILTAVYPVYCMAFRRLLPHVFKKQLKAVFPSIAYRYPLRPVSTIACIVRITCSGFHSLPANVLWTFYTETRRSVAFGNSPSLGSRQLSRFFTYAAARLGITTSKVRSNNLSFIPARTTAQKNLSPAFVPFGHFFNNSESSKCFAYHH